MSDMSDRKALIFGAGKIGRGFLAHLLDRSGYAITFVEPSPALVEKLREAGQYPLKMLGAPEKDTVIDGFAVLGFDDKSAVRDAVASHDLIFTAAGGPNLAAIGAVIATGLAQRLKTSAAPGSCNIIICENYKQPARLLREAIEADLDTQAVAWTREHLGIAETQVLRSCIEPDDAMKADNPLSLQVQDWWVLPCDAQALRGTPPAIEGLALKDNFQNELIRKLYTYNCSNAVISYLGYLRGYTMLHEAANDPDILAIALQAYEETGAALIAQFGFDPDEHRAMQQMALAKYQDVRITDPIERNARDARRKLAPDDRLLGPALLAVRCGLDLALALARSGSEVYVCGRNADKGAAAVAAGAGRVHFLQTDLSDPAKARAMVQQVAAEQTALDFLVNNAADDTRHAFDTATDADFEAQLAINLRPLLSVTQEALELLVRGQGRSIVNLCTTNYMLGLVPFTLYNASKSGIIGFTRSLARELGPQQIRANVLSPGWVMTAKQRQQYVTPEDEADLLRDQSLKRLLEPDDVTDAVLFLLSPLARAITGQNLVVDCGKVMP